MATLLLVIFTALSVFHPEDEGDISNQHTPAVKTRILLVFLAFFGWASVIGSYLEVSIVYLLPFSALSGGLAAYLTSFLSPLLSKLQPYRKLDLSQALSTTGRVLKPVPPHRNGFGKVHLDLQNAPYELEAVTAGRELPQGASVRIVKLLDDRILLVEPVEENDGKDALQTAPYPSREAQNPGHHGRGEHRK
ncbi:MAG: hypothetical protein R3350_03770 [Saprospiraceae bacterium]|nr:hypothetical protein [Saprospiraceae bacterium]